MDNYVSSVLECSRCGEILPRNKSIKWGKDLLCPACMEMICPSFNENQNKTETTTAFLRMKERYIGRKVKGIRNEVRRIDIDIYGRDFIHYYMDIAVDQRGIITDVSRLEAIMLPGPHYSYDEGCLYPIKEEDYSTTVDVIFQDDITFESDYDTESYW